MSRTDLGMAPFACLLLIAACARQDAVAPRGGPAAPRANLSSGPALNFYVSPTGSPSGDGSFTNPWDLATALSGPAPVTPGSTIWLRGGTYTDGTYQGAYSSDLRGTAAAPIVVRQYPGERTTLGASLRVFGSYTWFWGFEVVSPAPENGVQTRSTGAKLINLVIHDAGGTGLGLFDEPPVSNHPDEEAYGCIIYNNGNATGGYGNGIYANNANGYRKIRDNIVFNNAALGIQAYPQLNDATIDGNVSFNNGSISDYGGPTDLLVYTGGNPTRVVVTNNYLYRTDLAHATASIGYYFGGINPSLLFSGNYAFGLVAFADWVTATVTGNTVYSTASPYSQGASGMVSARGNLSGYRWRGNHWYGDPALPQWGYGPAGATPGTAYDYATWLTATGLTKPGTYGRSIPPNRVVVRPNAYEPGRANIIVYNWTQRSTVSVDVSAILNVGHHYVVQNAQDFYGAPTVSDTYKGGPLQLPMAGIPAPTPIRGGVPGPTTGPTFNVFVLIATP